MTKYILLGAVALLFAGCGLLSPAEQQTALKVIDDMLAQGIITPAQFDALREAILAKGTSAWWQELAQVAAGAALAYVGVEIRRGKPTQKVGLPASKVHP
jgi:uncharacterized protein YoaH (UPF0181 family)